MKNSRKIRDYICNSELDIDRIVDDFSPYVKKVIDNMVGNNLNYEDKEEILADVFFVLWKNKYKDILYLDSYIAGITRNLVKEKLKKVKITYDISDYENMIEYSNIDIFSNERDEIKKCLKSLKIIDQKIFNMFYYSAKTIKQISKELKISEFNVTTRLYRMRKKIKKELNKGGVNYGE